MTFTYIVDIDDIHIHCVDIDDIHIHCGDIDDIPIHCGVIDLMILILKQLFRGILNIGLIIVQSLVRKTNQLKD